jgi:hypothetical protein
VKSRSTLLALPIALVTLGGGLVQAAPSSSEEPKTTGEKKRKRVVSDMSGFELTPPEKLQQQTTVVGATRGLKPPPPVPMAPYLAKVLGPQPLFQWASKGTAFTFVLKDEAGQELVRKSLTENKYRYDGPALTAGKTYSWTVETQSGGVSDPSSFQVADAAERQAVEAGLAKIKGEGLEVDLRRARVLGDRRLWYDVVGAYTDMIARYPDKPQPYEERGMVLAQIPRTKNAAEEDFARADGLAPKR